LLKFTLQLLLRKSAKPSALICENPQTATHHTQTALIAFLANPFAILAVKPSIAFSFHLPLAPNSHSNSNSSSFFLHTHTQTPTVLLFLFVGVILYPVSLPLVRSIHCVLISGNSKNSRLKT
jgi:hypothetical protein